MISKRSKECRSLNKTISIFKLFRGNATYKAAVERKGDEADNS